MHVDLLWECFRHFYTLDHSNAAIHCAPVRYSPITFRLAEALAESSYKVNTWVIDVMTDKGLYEEDPGR